MTLLLPSAHSLDWLGLLGLAWLALLVLGVSLAALRAALFTAGPVADSPWHDVALYRFGQGLVWFGVVVGAGLAVAFGLLVLARLIQGAV